MCWVFAHFLLFLFYPYLVFFIYACAQIGGAAANRRFRCDTLLSAILAKKGGKLA